MAKTVTLRLDEETYRLFRQTAAAENRSVAKLIECAALARLRDEQFTDDTELQEILADDGLMRRLQAGSQDARARRGTFVE